MEVELLVAHVLDYFRMVQVDIYSILLGVITVLVGIVSFFARKTYEEMSETKKAIIDLKIRIVRIEVYLGIDDGEAV